MAKRPNTTLFGRYLAMIREQEGLKVSDVAKKYFTTDEILMFEHGYKPIPEKKLYQIAKCYNIPLEQFIQKYLKLVYSYITDEIPDTWLSQVKHGNFYRIKYELFPRDIIQTEVVKDIMKVKKLTYRYISKQIGVSHHMISFWTRQKYVPLLHNFMKFCSILGTTPSVILGVDPLNVIYEKTSLTWNNVFFRNILQTKGISLNKVIKSVDLNLYQVHSMLSSEYPTFRTDKLLKLCGLLDCEPDNFFIITKSRRKVNAYSPIFFKN